MLYICKEHRSLVSVRSLESALTLPSLAAGFCPFTEFERTKHDFGLCQNLHDESCKADWDAMDDRDRDRLGYERDLKKWLDKLMVDLKQKIARNEARLAAQEDVVLLPEDQVRTACRVTQTCFDGHHAVATATVR